MSLASPLVAHASCIAPPPLPAAIASAPTVFVGTVTEVHDGARVATVHVDDVWKGTGLGTVAEVVGTPDLGVAATSVDRTYVVEQQYLFVPNSKEGGRFQDNNCTLTQPYTEALASLRPQGASGFARDPGGSARPALLIAIGGLLFLLTVGGLAFVLIRRRIKPQLVKP